MDRQMKEPSYNVLYLEYIHTVETLLFRQDGLIDYLFQNSPRPGGLNTVINQSGERWLGKGLGAKILTNTIRRTAQTPIPLRAVDHIQSLVI